MTQTLAGILSVWGGEDLYEVQQCEVDSYGQFCGGPEFSGQDEIERQIAAGAREGVTDDGVHWQYRE